MEHWQVLHIDQNLSRLISTTRCTTQLKVFLRQNGLVTEEEDQKLATLGNNYGPIRESKDLYDILKTRTGAYQILLHALEETKQTGACDILRQGQQYQATTENENKTLARQLLEIVVELPGSLTSLQEFLPCFQMEAALRMVQCEKVKHEVSEIIGNSRKLKLTSDIPELHVSYIPRTVSNHLVLDAQVFNISCADVFVFKGVDIEDLKSLVRPHFTRRSSTQRRIITSRHIYLDDDKDWYDLKRVSSEPLHLVTKDNDEYVLQKSTGITSILLDHRSGRTSSKDHSFSEDQFVSKFISDHDGKGALICDVPGMGKTWLMHSIAHKIQLLCREFAVFFVQLHSFAKYLNICEDFSESANMLPIILQYVYSGQLLLPRLVSQYAEKIGLNLIFVLDGFDEVTDVNFGKCISVLRDVVAKNHVRFFISSRPHMQKQLEKTFNLISYNIHPFGKQEQVTSIVRHWRGTILGANEHSLIEYAKKCIDSCLVIQQRDENDILGVPLQCFLLAIAEEANAMHVTSANRKEELTDSQNETVIVRPIFTLYNKCFENLIQKSMATAILVTPKVSFLQSVYRFHTLKALELLFPEIATYYSQTFQTDTSIKEFVTKVGVLRVNKVSELEFVHKTFAEYFAGKFFAEFWMDLKSYEPAFVQSVGVFFLKNVMKNAGENLCHTWFNDFEHKARSSHLKSIVNKPGKIVVFENYTVLYFMNSFYACTSPSEECNTSFFTETLCQLKNPSAWNKLLAVFGIQSDMFVICKDIIKNFGYIKIIACINHGLSFVLRLLVSLIKSLFRDSERPGVLLKPVMFKEAPSSLSFLLCCVAASGCPEDGKAVFNLFGKSQDNILTKMFSNIPDQVWTPLEVAIGRNDLDMVVFFKDKFKTKQRNRLFSAVLTGGGITEAQLDNKVSIINVIFGGPGIFFSGLGENKVPDLFLYLKALIKIAWRYKFSLNHATLENKSSLLRECLQSSNDDEFVKLLLLLFPNEDRYGSDFAQRISSDSAFYSTDLKAEEFLVRLNIQTLKLAFPKRCIFFDPFTSLQSLEILKALIGICPTFTDCNSDRRNYLHYAVMYGKYEWVEYLIKSRYDINERDVSGNTPLHYITPISQAIELTQKLLDNRADVFSVNRENSNIAHTFFNNKYLIMSGLKVASDWVNYIIEIGYGKLWYMKDCKGNTPFDLLSKELGPEHPASQKVSKILREHGISNQL